MRAHGYTYEAVPAASERVNWRVTGLIGDDERLDFSRPFLPESLARVEPLTFVSARGWRYLGSGMMTHQNFTGTLAELPGRARSGREWTRFSETSHREKGTQR